MQVEQEFPIGVEFRRCTELLHNLLRLDRMDAHPLHTGVFEAAVLDQPGYEGYGSHLAHQRRVEARAFSVNSGSASRLYPGPQPSHPAGAPAASPHEA